MKYCLLLVYFIQYAFAILAQKKAIDQQSVAMWPHIMNESISSNGKYVLYTVTRDNFPPLLCIRSVSGKFTMDIAGGRNGAFVSDGRCVAYITPGDSLCVVEIESEKRFYTAGIESFKMQQIGDKAILACRSIAGGLMIYNLTSGEKLIYDSVEDYSFSPTGRVLVVFQKSSSLECPFIVNWVDVETGNSRKIFQGQIVSSYIFNQHESKLAFLSSREPLDPKPCIWVYEAGKDSARIVVDEGRFTHTFGFRIAGNFLKFSSDDKRLFFDAHRLPDSSNFDARAVSVDIWNYKDKFLQCDQLANPELAQAQNLLFVFDLEKDNIIRLEQENDGLWSLWIDGSFNQGDNDNYWLTLTKVNLPEGSRIPKERPDIYLVDTRNGDRTCIKRKLLNGMAYFSPAGKYVYWYDLIKRGFYTYNIRTKVTKSITGKIPFALYNELFDGVGSPYPYNCCVWMDKDEGLLIYDRYDIWQVDSDGEKVPINVTNGYGRKNRVVLRLVYTKGRGYLDEPPVKRNEDLLLCALNERNKDNGFFKKKLGMQGDPIELSMNANLFYFSGSLFVDLSPVIYKAKDSSAYLLYRMSATDYPNLCVTRDFRSFQPVSDLAPERTVKWMTDELVRWRTFDGRLGEGILYKPEGFDPGRKYPIIFYFYDRLSDGLHKFLQPSGPDWRTGPMNIPWFVSRDYLVFCPDIYYIAGDPGKGIYNYVVSAAAALSQRPWVDSTRMGMQGHSWGGYEVNYLITRTRLFSAAASAAGASDLISNSGEEGFGTCAGQDFTETGSYRMGVSLWQNPTGYIKNSPVLNADKVVTPLLMMQNKNDPIVPWSQGVELFTALRRLGKPCWMLQYDDGNHIVSGPGGLDYTIRLTQFFDHYLKQAPAPKWMTEGIPARLKGIDSGLEMSIIPQDQYKQ